MKPYFLFPGDKGYLGTKRWGLPMPLDSLESGLLVGKCLFLAIISRDTAFLGGLRGGG